MTQGWKLPDGTPCGRESAARSGSPAGARYCISGECRFFDCDGLVTDSYADTGSCINNVESNSISENSLSSLSLAAKQPLPQSVTTWSAITACFDSCLANGQGIRLVTKSCQES